MKVYDHSNGMWNPFHLQYAWDCIITCQNLFIAKEENSLSYFLGRTHGSTFYFYFFLFLYVRTKHGFKSSCKVGNLAKKPTILKVGLRILDRSFHLSSMVSLGVVLKPKVISGSTTAFDNPSKLERE